MKLSEAYPIVKNAIKLKTPVMLWGPPGIGKSSLIHQIAKEENLNVIDLRLAQLEPTDLRGVPMPNKDTGRADWFLPSFWPTAASKKTTTKTIDSEGNSITVNVEVGNGVNGPGIIFLDEIEKAPTSVKNASLQLVLDRMIGSYKLPNDWAVICAGNREEDGCFSQPLGSALSNRMAHLEIDADLEAWAKWARDNCVSEDIISFLHFKPDLLYKQTEDHAFPTPRSWVMGSNLIKMIKTQKDRKELLTASVGRDAASEFTVWNNVYRSVDPEAILNGNIPNFDKSEQSFKFAVTMATAFYLRKRKGGIKNIEENVVKFLETITCELRVMFLRQQTSAVLESMYKNVFFKNMIKEMVKIIS